MALSAIVSFDKEVHMSRDLLLIVVAALGVGFSAGAFPQAYPSRPIRVIVPASPGGAADILSRTIAQKLSDAWGQQVIVDNRTGAAGIIGAEAAAKAPNDGYTIMMGFAGVIAVNPSLYRTLPYDSVKDYAPVTLVALSPLMLVVHPAVPATSVNELIALAKAQPGQLNFASTGSGSTQHLSAELFKSMAGISMTHIPYKGSSLAYPDLLAGNVSLMFENMLSMLPNAKSGKVRALAVTGTKRSAALPEVPTVGESVPGFSAVGWYGVLAPAGTDAAIVNKLSAEINRILRLPEVNERLSSLGAEPTGSTPEEFAAHIKAEIAKWGKVVRDSGARIE
jgi:tripartite-type tricarboxylate transporter receptor subunit TctC